MNKILQGVGKLFFDVDFSAAIDDAFRDYAQMSGEEPAGPPITVTGPENARKNPHSIIYIYDTHATNKGMDVSLIK